MSTAHRPTFNPARGSRTGVNVAIPTKTVRALDLPGETKLLHRDAPSEANKKELKRKLEASDPALSAAKRRPESQPLAIENPGDEISFPEDADELVLAESSDEDSSDDDEEDLLRELARIKEERAEEEAKRLAEEAARERAIQEQEMSGANPLIGGAAVLRRRWDDDTVFQGQARNAPKNERRFVNDVVRSEFHKKFLNKYIV